MHHSQLLLAKTEQSSQAEKQEDTLPIQSSSNLIKVEEEAQSSSSDRSIRSPKRRQHTGYWVGDVDSSDFRDLKLNNSETYQVKSVKRYRIKCSISTMSHRLGNKLVSGVTSIGGDGIVKREGLENERKALLEFKQGLVYDHGILTSWRIEEDKSECCKWKGVECSSNPYAFGNIMSLKSQFAYDSLKELNGDFGFKIKPISLFITRFYKILSLSELWLSDNKLRRSFPKSFGQTSLLNSLDLSKNELNGSFPHITPFPLLSYLSLSNNKLKGRLPKSIGHLSNLKGLDLCFPLLTLEFSFDWTPPFQLDDFWPCALDLSSNNFSSKNQSITQLQRFNASVYAGNRELCEHPLPNKYLEEDESASLLPSTDHGYDKTDEEDEDRVLNIGAYEKCASFTSKFVQIHFEALAIKEAPFSAINGLPNAANKVIGDEGHRGFSGGECRRVSIGIELIRDPIILLLDEPTSSLDSTSAFMAVEVLQRIAHDNVKGNSSEKLFVRPWMGIMSNIPVPLGI
ncbi:hypothetical protein LguiB_006240 [Lonicera macranthoides]